MSFVITVGVTPPAVKVTEVSLTASIIFATIITAVAVSQFCGVAPFSQI